MSASRYHEKGPPKSSVNEAHSDVPSDDVASGNVVDVTAGSQALHRKLRGKEVQLFAIGGAIGTCKQMKPTTSARKELR
jgi:yeast amino acid transporter